MTISKKITLFSNPLLKVRHRRLSVVDCIYIFRK